MEAFYEKLAKVGIVPVVKINDAGKAVALAETLLANGLGAIEVTFRSDAAEESIANIAKKVPGISVCAGTVLGIENAKRAVDAGAAGVISPGTNLDVVSWCSAHNIPVLPGCATPTEVEQCMRLGLRAVKLFPAQVVGGVAMLKALAGPYASMKFMPTGGISLETVPDFLKLSNVFAAGGSWIASEKAIDGDNFDEIGKLAAQAAKLVESLRTCPNS